MASEAVPKELVMKSPTASVRQTADARPFGDVDAAGGAVGIKTGPKCEECEGSGETGHTWHDGTGYSDRNPPCVTCSGTGIKP